ncbi:PACE efflux transporter [Cypionkella psychrotolerans]|uniref:PACE efflux transporter n=1 Tax=Cypionkella psychrotolerans TaxID=1678131 RepID=UPI0006B4FA0B|nr:PACE efflux transporter [Cypionkella psychrotolerans]
MTPTLRKILYAVSFETLGVAVATLGLLAMSEANATQSLILSAITATIAMGWSMGFNALFEAWEARQTTKGRSLARRSVHALLFEGGLVILVLPLMAWWLQVDLWTALQYEAGLILLFIIYTYVFTYSFDRIFGLPQSAR